MSIIPSITVKRILVPTRVLVLVCLCTTLQIVDVSSILTNITGVISVSIMFRSNVTIGFPRGPCLNTLRLCRLVLKYPNHDPEWH